jgi:hypothetical protein
MEEQKSPPSPKEIVVNVAKYCGAGAVAIMIFFTLVCVVVRFISWLPWPGL